MNQQERRYEIECFKSTLRRGIREWILPTMTESEAENAIHKLAFTVKVPMADVHPELKLPRQVGTLVDFELRGRWHRVHFEFFFLRCERIDGDLFAIYEGHG